MEIKKTVDEREMQKKKIIIIIIINERKTNKGRKEQGEQTEAIVKG